MEQNNKFRAELEALHEELHNTKSVDEETKQLLEDVQSDIQYILDETERDDTEAHQSLNDRLRQAAGQMESTHPELTNTMRRVMTVLSNMGI